MTVPRIVDDHWGQFLADDVDTMTETPPPSVSWLNPGPDRNQPRPSGSYLAMNRCRPCDVKWRGEPICWVCGRKVGFHDWDGAT